jgi:hypothetical protein
MKSPIFPGRSPAAERPAPALEPHLRNSRRLESTGTNDSDENPSSRRIASWMLDGADLGVLGLAWALIVGIWARRRYRRRMTG